MKIGDVCLLKQSATIYVLASPGKIKSRGEYFIKKNQYNRCVFIINEFSNNEHSFLIVTLDSGKICNVAIKDCVPLF